MSDPSAASRTSGYRPDIQGLRALAVGLVILAHGGFDGLAGGFVGVDVFFVISGFLIIGLLTVEVEGSGGVSISGFYARRARRVLPAATIVLAVTAMVSVLLLPFVRAVNVIEDTVWSAFFLANVRFSLVETDYFSKGEPPSPVQHYWSLAVEEQFYLVIPLVLLGIALGARRAGRVTGMRPVLRRWIALGMLAVTLLSLAWSLSVTAADPTAAYFSTPARAWELALGGLLATVAWGRTLPGGRWGAELLGVAGLVLIAVATLEFSGRTPFPGAAALVPVLGAALLLAAGAVRGADASWISRLLSARPMRVVGDWSYSLYLWHFPVFQFIRHWGSPGLFRTFVAIGLTFLLAAATYRWIEQPFRRGVRWKVPGRALVLYPASLTIVVATAWSSQAWVDHQLAALSANPAISVDEYDKSELDKDPALALVQASLLAAKEGKPVPGGLRPSLDKVGESIAPLGECDYRTDTTQLCPIGDTDADRVIAVLGDSHGRAMGPAIGEIGAEHGYRVYQLVRSACPANQGAHMSGCRQFNDWVLTQLDKLQPELVVIANNAYSRPGFGERQFPGLAAELKQLRAPGRTIAMIGNTPVLDRTPGVCLSRRGVDLGDCTMTPDTTEREAQRHFGDIVEKNGGIFIDAMKWFCVDEQCPAVIGDMIPMRDDNHVSVEYAKHLAVPLARELGLAR